MNNNMEKNIMPFMIEKNMGQHKNESKFVLRNNKGVVYFLQSEIIFAMMNIEEDKVQEDEFQVNFINMKLENCNKQAKLQGIGEFDCKINYFKGEDESQWTTDIPVYEEILYEEIYPNIDLSYYTNKNILEHDFIVKPNGNVNNIKIIFEGIDKIEKYEEENLLISSKGNTLQMLKPKVYQNIGNKKVDIESNFIVEGNSVKFNIHEYDKSQTLVIDPQLLYGSYLGGNSDDWALGVAVGENKNAYITGYTFSTNNFPLKNEYQPTNVKYYDVFLIKIDTTLSGKDSLKYGTFIGGSDYEIGYGVAVDNAQNAYITGYTKSSDFPRLNAYQNTLGGVQDAFLIKIDTTLSGTASLKYGTYLGGGNTDVGYGVAVDSAQNAYITGSTKSTDFPRLNAYQNTFGGSTDAFLAKIDTTLTGTASLKYSTYLGGSSDDEGRSVAIDNGNIAYITGYTKSTNFPKLNAYQNTFGGSADAFLAKIDTALSGTPSLKYATYLGGSGDDSGAGVAVDSNQTAYITGYTKSSDFPTLNPYQQDLKGSTDAFLSKIDTTLSGSAGLKYSTYLGGSSDDAGTSVAIDSEDNAYITGSTFSDANSFPLKNPYEDTLKGGNDAFLIKINTSLSGNNSLLYGSYIGGDGNGESGRGVAVDDYKNAYIVGCTNSKNSFPLKNEYEKNQNGYNDAFLVKLNTNPPISELILEKYTCKCTPAEGEKIPYTLKVTNNGPDTATNIIVKDRFYTILKVDSYDKNTGTISNKNTPTYTEITWEIPTLDVGESAVAIITVIPYKTSCQTGGEYIKNTASLTSDTKLAYTSITTRTSFVYVQCEKSSNELILEKNTCKCTAKIGEKIPYTLKVTNKGPDTAINITVTDIFDDKLKINSYCTTAGTIQPPTNNQITWTIENLNSGESAQCLIIATPIKNLCKRTEGTFIENTATLTSDTQLSDTSITTSTSLIYVECKSTDKFSDLVLKKTVYSPSYDWSFQSKGDIWYKIKVTNNGPDTATNVIITDPIDKNMDILSANSAIGKITTTGNLIVWEIDTLAVGESWECKIKVKPKPAILGKYVKNTASVKSDNIATNPQHSISSVIVYIRIFNC